MRKIYIPQEEGVSSIIAIVLMIAVTVILAVAILIYVDHQTTTISKTLLTASMVETSENSTMVKMIFTFTSPSVPIKGGNFYVSVNNIPGSGGPYYLTLTFNGDSIETGANIIISIAGSTATTMSVKILNPDSSIAPSGSATIHPGFTGSWTGTSVSISVSNLLGSVSTTLP